MKYIPFDQALESSQETERRVKHALIDRGCQVSPSDDKEGRDFTVAFPEKAFVPLRVEVKDETKKAHTGNLCVEMSQAEPRRSSGVMTSVADVTLHVLGPRVALYLTKCMRELVISARAYPKLNTGMWYSAFGDNKNEGMIVRIEAMRNHPWFDVRRWDDFCDSPIWHRTACGNLNAQTAPLPWTAPGRSSGDRKSGWLFDGHGP